MLELVAQILAYSAVGLVILVAGFYVLDLVTPGNLAQLIMGGNPNASILAASTLGSLGLVLWFAVFFSPAGWEGLDDAAVYGAVAVAVQAIGFFVLEMVIPGRLRDITAEDPANRLKPATWVASSVQIAVALVVCASLT